MTLLATLTSLLGLAVSLAELLRSRPTPAVNIITVLVVHIGPLASGDPTTWCHRRRGESGWDGYSKNND